MFRAPVIGLPLRRAAVPRQTVIRTIARQRRLSVLFVVMVVVCIGLMGAKVIRTGENLAATAPSGPLSFPKHFRGSPVFKSSESPTPGRATNPLKRRPTSLSMIVLPTAATETYTVPSKRAFVYVRLNSLRGKNKM